MAMGWAARYMNISADGLAFEARKDFVEKDASAQELQAIIAGYVQGAIPVSDYLSWMQEHSIVDGEKTLDEFTAEVGTNAMPNLGA